MEVRLTERDTTRRAFVSGVAAAGLTGACGSLVREGVGVESMETQRPVHQVLRAPEQHWVGDGFAVRTAFSPRRIDPDLLSPFIMLDHAKPKYFPPADAPRGVGEHPHRGFETVTFSYQGEVKHRDSHGGGGTIGPGDVQWMTAGAGVVHEEFHSERLTREGGVFEMVQLWVNLPAREKMVAPKYQALRGTSFPAIVVGDMPGRLVAGSYGEATGPAETHTPMTIFDLTADAGHRARFDAPEGHTVLVQVLEGALQAGDERADQGDVVVFDRSQMGSVRFEALEASRVLVLSGEPLGEPVVAHGPFVMNTRQEIHEAIRDYQMGKMGRLAPAT